MEAKYGATYVKSYVDQYYIINSDFNTSLNPWKDIEDKDYIKSLLKSDISSFKQNFELDYFTYAYLAYYGYIPNFLHHMDGKTLFMIILVPILKKNY